MTPPVRIFSRFGHLMRFALVAVALGGGGVATALAWPQPQTSLHQRAVHPADVDSTYAQLTQASSQLQDKQTRIGQQVVPLLELQQAFTAIELNVATAQYNQARLGMASLHRKLAAWNAQFAQPQVQISDGQTLPTAGIGITAPILLYHYTPSNFRAQLEHLRTHNYTVVSLDQIAAALTNGASLPPKPVAITFDDGFSNQMEAFALLQEYRYPATFYIINSGEASRWCIGSGRRYNDPLQPPGGCGDSYLNWDQVRQLDRSGLITIGAHTLDHENLAGDSPERQATEIIQSKSGIEREIGHAIKHFCYPYGAYNQATISIVQQAGFSTATTTAPGTIQPPGSLYTLRRIRDTLTLP